MEANKTLRDAQEAWHEGDILKLAGKGVKAAKTPESEALKGALREVFSTKKPNVTSEQLLLNLLLQDKNKK